MLTPSANGPYTATPITALSEKGAHGEWASDWAVVNDSSLYVDEKHELVYFVATRDSPLETHLNVASYPVIYYVHK